MSLNQGLWTTGNGGNLRLFCQFSHSHSDCDPPPAVLLIECYLHVSEPKHVIGQWWYHFLKVICWGCAHSHWAMLMAAAAGWSGI